jgi:hypothetical protein
MTVDGLEDISRELRAPGKDDPILDLDIWDAGDLAGPIPPRPWLLDNQFCRGFVSSLVSAGGVGKTALRLLQFISLAINRSLCGQYIFRRSRVLLISLEDDRDELQRRIQAVLDHYQVSRADLQGWFFCTTPSGSRLAELEGNKRVVGKLEQQVRRAIELYKPDLVAIDPFVKTHSLGENNSADMNFVCDLLARIAIENNVAVDVPHHVHKGQIAAGDADAGRGSSGIRDAGRLNFTLTPMSENEAEMFGIDHGERFRYVRLDASKVNIAVRSGRATWFQIIGVRIKNATDDYPNGDTVQVVEPWTPPEVWADLDNQMLNRILDAIDSGLRDEYGRPTGERYTDASGAKKRAAWRVVEILAPGKTEDQCRSIIREWVRNGVLEADNYYSRAERREVTGLRVNAAKRPGTETRET